MHKTLLCLSIAALSMPAIAQFNLVIPNGLATTEGNSSTAYPWSRAAAVIHVQYCYDSTHFTNQGVAVPILINRLRWRANSSTAATVGGTYSNVVIDMSTAAVDQAVLTTTFATNHGPDRANVYTGSVTVLPTPSIPTTSPLTPNIWYVDQAITPFLYDPSSGSDLLIDIAFPAASWVGGTVAVPDCQTTGALVSRMYNLTSDTAATGTFQANVGLTVDVNYAPAAGLYPEFSGTPRTGPLGQLVNFTDQSYTSDPGGITSWSWDVDGDNITDYTTQNCAHTYTTEGAKNVTLTVTSAMFGSQSETKNGYVVIGAVDASFTAAIGPGTLVAFTDTSAGNPTTWAWDFTNDGIVDSALQHPAFVYPAPGQYTCRLTVTDAFSNDTTTTTLGMGIIPLPPFVSTFSGTAATRGFWFQAPTRFSVISAQVPDEFNDGTQNVALYRLTGAPPVYSATATGGLEFASVGQPSATAIPCAVSYDVGEFVGVLGACGTTTMRNSYGTPAGPFASSVLGVPCTLTRMGTQFNLFTTMGTTAYWQEPGGNITRVILAVTACAALPYGLGSPSGAGPVAPTMRATALPFIGQTSVLSVTQNDANVLMVMAVGFGRTSLPSPYGTILVNSILGSEIMNGAAVVGPGSYTYSFSIPNNPAYIGLAINWQNANLVISSGQVSLSNGVEFWLDV